MSGGTQTDLKSYSVGGTSGAQLSASVRERLLLGSQSLPKPRTDTGSLSDSNYADLAALSSPYSAMYRHTAAYTSSLPTRTTAGNILTISLLLCNVIIIVLTTIIIVIIIKSFHMLNSNNHNKNRTYLRFVGMLCFSITYNQYVITHITNMS